MAPNLVPVTLGSPRFSGRDVGSLRITEAFFPPGTNLPRHAHARPVMAVVLAGSWDERLGGREYACLPGSVLIEPAEAPHSHQFRDPEARVLILEVDPTRVELFASCAELLGEAGCFEHWGVAALARRVAAELANPDDPSGLLIEGLALDMLAFAARRPRALLGGPPPTWFTRVLERLHSEFHRQFRLVDLAETAGVHPMHLARMFRNRTGMSIGDYQRRLRLDWCADQLVNTRVPVGEIAQGAGFADQSHLSRNFRRYTGVTPHAYRAGRNGLRRWRGADHGEPVLGARAQDSPRAHQGQPVH